MRLALLAFPILVAACAPSPLYVGRHRVNVAGPIPRDERGEPVWSLIPPAPPAPVAAPPIRVDAGPPVIPPA